MDEYINRKDALRAMSKARQDRTWSMDDFDVMEQMEEYVATLPKADVAPVIHGYVAEHRGVEDDYYCECSVCGTQEIYIDDKYCPECGAKMDED